MEKLERLDLPFPHKHRRLSSDLEMVEFLSQGLSMQVPIQMFRHMRKGACDEACRRFSERPTEQ